MFLFFLLLPLHERLCVSPPHTIPRQAGAEELLREVRARHVDFVALERSMLELHQLYLDLAVLVEAQGQNLDSIEMQVRGV
jgi:t-SNARE complex subunit (syntaxin)